MRNKLHKGRDDPISLSPLHFIPFLTLFYPYKYNLNPYLKHVDEQPVPTEQKHLNIGRTTAKWLTNKPTQENIVIFIEA